MAKKLTPDQKAAREQVRAAEKAAKTAHQEADDLDAKVTALTEAQPDLDGEELEANKAELAELEGKADAADQEAARADEALEAAQGKSEAADKVAAGGESPPPADPPDEVEPAAPPKRGEPVTYVYLVNGPALREAPAKVQKVHKDGTVDLEVTIPPHGPRTRKGVAEQTSPQQADCWRRGPARGGKR